MSNRIIAEALTEERIKLKEQFKKMCSDKGYSMNEIIWWLIRSYVNKGLKNK